MNVLYLKAVLCSVDTVASSSFTFLHTDTTAAFTPTNRQNLHLQEKKILVMEAHSFPKLSQMSLKHFSALIA